MRSRQSAHPEIRKLLLGLVLAIGLAAAAAWGESGDDFHRAEQLYRAGQLTPAASIYSRLGPRNTHYAAAQLRLGTIYYLTAHPRRAEKHLANYLRLHESAEAYILLSGAQFNQGKYGLAADSARQALRIDPKAAKAYTALGMVLTAQNQWPQAEADYRQALKLNSQDSDSWFMFGQALFRRDDFARAADAFQKAVQINPRCVRCEESLARVLDIEGDARGAEAAYRNGLEACRRQGLPQSRLDVEYAEFLLKLNRLGDAREILEQAARHSAQDAGVHYTLAKTLFRMSRYADAAREAETALRLGGDDYRVDFLLAQVYTALGNPKEASRYAGLASKAAARANH